jgi:calcium permeable stress-gated cation channel
MRTQKWYFAFQVIQVFLITTFTSGASAVATQITQNPASAPMLLAKNLPKASNFYISYFIVYGLAMASKTLFNVVALLMFNVVGRILDKSPRKMYKRYISLSGTGWGSVYPKWTNLTVIGMYNSLQFLL